MEATQRSSRKRKQPPSSPFSGVFTRQKSQLFSHTNRSGISRPDPDRLRKIISSFPPHPLINTTTGPQLGKFQKSPPSLDNDEAIYHLSIKDLRARRIFSKPQSKQLGSLTEAESGKTPNPNSFSQLNDGKSDSFVKSRDETRSNGGSLAERSDSGTDLKTRHCSDGENPDLPVAAKYDSIGKNPNSHVVHGGGNFKGEGPNVENPNSSAPSIVGKKVLDGVKEQKFKVGFNCLEKFPNHLSPSMTDLKGGNREDCEGLTEINVQTTPPDAVIQMQQRDDGIGLQNRNGCSRLPPKKSSHINVEKNSSDFKRNMVLKPCLRTKLFKASNSFSYRRLLPYLMDIAKDKSSAMKVAPSAKIEIDASGKSLVSSSQESITDTSKFDEKPPAILTGLSSQEVSINGKEEEKGSLELKASDLNTEKAAIENPVNCSQDKSIVNWVSPQSQIKNPMENDSKKGGLSTDEHEAFNNIGMLPDVSPTVQPDRVDSSVDPKGSPDGILEGPCQLSLYAVGECRTAQVKFKSDESSISVFHSAAELEAVVSSGVPAAVLEKGILKRNPRGCRGICNCLNCASFRLNAGKAFEFSRNQMLDAQELVLDMMKELSNLRVMLEKSINDSNNHAILPVDQVQEARRRASNIEDIARNRLSQMNEDLYVHCRTKTLERPRVNFTSSVEEMVIGKSTKETDINNASRSLAL